MNGVRNILVLGGGAEAKLLAREIVKKGNGKLNLLGFVADGKNVAEFDIEGGKYPVLGEKRDLWNIAKDSNADTIVIASGYDLPDSVMRTISQCVDDGYVVRDMPLFYEEIIGRVPIFHIDDSWIAEHILSVSLGVYPQVKRFLDYVGAMLGLVVSLPIFLVVALAVKLDSRGHFFTHKPV